MSREKNIQIFSMFMPEEAAKIIAKWVDYFQVEVKITKSRSSIYGDYRHPHGNKGHRISINHDQNKYAFLITMVHEFAHLSCWNKFKHTIKPHGDEWKQEFKKIMQPFYDRNIFPDDIIVALNKYLQNPAASGCTDHHLMKALAKYNENKNIVLLSTLPAGAYFSLKNKQVFIKGPKVRTRYRCVEIATKNIYLVSGTAEVVQRFPENASNE